MKKEDFEEIRIRYEKMLEEFGPNHKALGWNNIESQKLRFKVLSEIDNLNNSTLIDIGCGFGDLYYYLYKSGIKIEYTGVEISPRLIEIAKEKYPGVNFMIKNIIFENIRRQYDYVFLSGVLNTKVSDNYSFAKKMLRKMYEICKKGMSVNMLTNYVDYKKEDIFYYSPEKIFSFCKEISRYVVLRHDYHLYEFTIYVYKYPKES